MIRQLSAYLLAVSKDCLLEGLRRLVLCGQYNPAQAPNNHQLCHNCVHFGSGHSSSTAVWAAALQFGCAGRPAQLTDSLLDFWVFVMVFICDIRQLNKTLASLAICCRAFPLDLDAQLV